MSLKAWLFLFTATATSLAAAQTSVYGNDLQAELSYQLNAAQPEIKSGEKAWLTLTEHNVTDHSVMIWIENTSDPGGLVFPIEVRDERGQLRPEGRYTRALKGIKDPALFTAETPVNRSGGCVPLRPGESRSFHLEVGRLYDITAPGRYLVTLVDHRASHASKAVSNTALLSVLPHS